MELNKKIHAKVKHNGYITFDDYMDICLYSYCLSSLDKES